MKSSVLYSLVLVLIFGGITIAQEPVYNWGEPITNADLETNVVKFLGADDNGFYLIRGKKVSVNQYYWLEHFGTDLSLESSTKINYNVGVMGNSQFIKEFERVEGQNYVFTEKWNKETESFSLHISKLEEGEIGEPTELDNIIARKMMNSGFYHVQWSQDRSKLLVLAELPYEKKSMEKIRLSCFDVTDDFAMLWQKDITLENQSKRARHNDIRVDNNANAYLFKRIWEKPDWKYKLFTFNAVLESWSEIPMKMEENEMKEWYMEFDANDNFTFLGLYSIKKGISMDVQVNGMVYLKLDQASLKTLVYKESDWSEAMSALDEASLKRLADAGMRIEPRKTLGSYFFKDVLFRNDGKVLILMEEKRQKKTPVSGRPGVYNYINNYGPVVTMALNEETGLVDWVQVIKKDQEIPSTEEVDHFGSFVYFLRNDRLVVIYNNTELSRPSIPPAFWKEADGTKYVKHKAFDENTIHGSFLYVVEPDGQLTFGDRTHGLPLFTMHRGAIFPMSMATHFFFPYNDGVVFMSEMHNGGKRYRYGLLSY